MKTVPKKFSKEIFELFGQISKAEREREKIEEQIAEKIREYKKKTGLDKLDKKIETLDRKIDKANDRIDEVGQNVMDVMAKGAASDDFAIEIKSFQQSQPSYKTISLELAKKIENGMKMFTALKDKYTRVRKFHILTSLKVADECDMPIELNRKEVEEPKPSQKRKQKTTGPHSRTVTGKKRTVKSPSKKAA